jgi:GNAT superfamily N-acetyltransferase
LAIVFESLNKRHNRAGFSCGQDDLDDWFHKRASQDERRNLARVFVAVDDALGLVGFYSLSTFTLALEDLPEDLASKLPQYKAIPAALIGRLARDVRVRGQGVGDLLLADAVRRILGASKSLAVYAIVVEAKGGASSFYESFGFRPFPLHPNRLFMLAKSAAAAIARLDK